MKQIKLNYINLMVLLGIEKQDAINRIVKCHSVLNKKQIPPFTKITGRYLVGINEFDKHPSTHNHIQNVLEYGIGYDLKKEVLSNMGCLMRGKLYGKYSFLSRLIPKWQLEEITEALIRRKKEFISSGGRVPKKLNKYIDCKPITLFKNE